ncbi:MAG: metallopeptidase family protein [Nocardioidaceae bacterium]
MVSREPDHRRRRDRHGRGIRGPLVPAGVPARRSPAQRFDEYVLDAVERLEHRWPQQMQYLDFGVEDVPPTAPAGPDAEWDDSPVPLARLFPAGRNRRARIVLYRRPVEARAVPDELPALVHDIVVEEVAHMLGKQPEEVDPRYGDG